jgi:hypothetical protein
MAHLSLKLCRTKFQQHYVCVFMFSFCRSVLQEYAFIFPIYKLIYSAQNIDNYEVKFGWNTNWTMFKQQLIFGHFWTH